MHPPRSITFNLIQFSPFFYKRIFLQKEKERKSIRKNLENMFQTKNCLNY